MRVFQGVTGQAGQPSAIAKGLRALGVEAQAGSIADHKFGYTEDFRIELTEPQNLEHIYRHITDLAENFDVFHFHARSLATDWPYQLYPSLLDLLALKERGKKVFFHFRGQEIRTAVGFSSATPFNYVKHRKMGRLFKTMPDESKLASLKFISAVADGLFVTDPELQTYVPNSTIIPRVLNSDDWENVGVSNKAIPLVVHAPSRRGVKGTETILAAVKELQHRLQFDFQLIEGVSHAEACAIYAKADIVIDQLRIGWYGVLATEAMALGKPTIAYIREDLWDKYGSGLPIINANPDTIADVLEETLTSREIRQKKAIESRKYFLETHSSNKVCQQLIDIYANTEIKPVDWVSVGNFMDRQRRVELKMLSKFSIFPTQHHSIRRFATLWSYMQDNGAFAAGRLIVEHLRQRFSR